MAASPRILLTGATGCVGGALLKRFAAEGRAVRCLVRRPAALPAAPGVEVVAGDALDPASLARAMQGIDAAYYLIHSMADSADFAALERRCAENFGKEAARAGVKRIIFLGALGSGRHLSPHLESRRVAALTLRESGVPVIELRAAAVLGAGSLSFELIRALVDRLPVMVVPRWAQVKTQPIAAEDAIDYLAACLNLPAESAVYEIGGADRVSYLDMMKEYARQSGRRRRFITVPVLTPRLSSLWLGLVTPVQARVGRALIEGIRHETVVEDPAALHAFKIRPRGLSESIRLALAAGTP